MIKSILFLFIVFLIFGGIKLHQSESNKTSSRSPASIAGYFSDTFKIYPNVNPCSSDYSKIVDCFNEFLPPEPSIMRSLITPDINYATKAELSSDRTEEDENISTFPNGDGVSDKYQIMPFTRSSNDGRLIVSESNHGPQLSIMRPGAVDTEFRNRTYSLMGTPTILHPFVYQNPRVSRLDHSIYTGWGRPNAYHYNLCDASGSGEKKSNPRNCRARLDASSPYIKGDCYDVTMMVGGDQTLNHGHGNFQRWELRSNDITVFVPAGKAEDNHAVWVYPRFVTPTLPDYAPYRDWVGSGPEFNQTANKCYGANPPAWCPFLLNQKRSPTYSIDLNGNNKVDNNEYWSGDHCDARNKPGCKNLFFFEISTTDDGMLMVWNLGGSAIYYSYNSIGPCRADGWSNFKPMSYMPIDPAIYQKYDIAKSMRRGQNYIPFRDSAGRQILPGQPFVGAYGWMDRKGKNFLFTPVTGGRDHVRANWQYPSSYTDYPSQNLNPDMTAGKMISAVGAWTRGKIVVLDNALNLSDFGGKNSWTNFGNSSMPVQYQYGLSLYDGEETLIRPKATTFLLSPENQLNYYNSFSPTIPFDVVWKVSAVNQRQAEVAFDEYHTKNAFVVAHMNAPMTDRGALGYVFPDDGFVAESPGSGVLYGGQAKFGFKKSPLIQNASTLDPFFEPNADEPPKTLRLLGGARIEPVALGGVIGKGVYLDGQNDHIDMGFKNPKGNDWFISAWFDSRQLSATQVRTLFYFPDKSWIGLSQKEIVAHTSRPFPNPTRRINISSIGLKEKTYFHFGVRIQTINKIKSLHFYINGTLVHNFGTAELKFDLSRTPEFYQGFQLKLDYNNGWSWFVIGDPGNRFSTPTYPQPRLPFKGWVDEFRIYSLGTSEKNRNGYFEEFICNLALGSLAEVDQQDRQTDFSSLLDRAYKHGLIRNQYTNARGSIPYGDDTKARVCEQLNISSHKAPTDLVAGEDKTLCLDSVHRNPSEALHETEQDKCVRKKMLGVQNITLEPNQPRPRFDHVPFCISCHSTSATISGLSMSALTYNPHVTRSQDPRRQPLDFPAKINGCLPGEESFPMPDILDRCDLNSYLMDFMFDRKHKIP